MDATPAPVDTPWTLGRLLSPSPDPPAAPMASSPIVMSLATGTMPKIPVTPVTTTWSPAKMPSSGEYTLGQVGLYTTPPLGQSHRQESPVAPGSDSTAMRNRE